MVVLYGKFSRKITFENLYLVDLSQHNEHCVLFALTLRERESERKRERKSARKRASERERKNGRDRARARERAR